MMTSVGIEVNSFVMDKETGDLIPFETLPEKTRARCAAELKSRMLNVFFRGVAHFEPAPEGWTEDGPKPKEIKDA